MDNITQYATQFVDEAIREKFKDELNDLEKIALKFLTNIQELLKQLKLIDENLKDLNKISINDIYTAMKKSTYFTQQITNYQYTFEEELNNFLKREIHFIWIDSKDGQIYYADQATAKKIYTKGTAKEGGRAGVSITKREFEISENTYSTIKTLTDNLGETGKEIQNRIGIYKNLYLEVLRRWEQNSSDKTNPYYNLRISKVKYNKKLKQEQIYDQYPYRNTFYWWIPEIFVWEHSAKMNRGNISQTYIHILLNHPNSKDQSLENELDKVDNYPDENAHRAVKKYWKYMQNHKLLNNISGIVEGDVSLFSKKSMQFAVKEGNFNTASIGPYITTAYFILHLPKENFSIDDIFDKINTLSSKLKSKAGTLVTDKIFESSLDEYIKR